MGKIMELNRQFIKASFMALRQKKKLIIFPIISSASVIFVFLLFFFPNIFLGKISFSILEENIFNSNTRTSFYLLLFLFYLISYFIIIFFNAGLMFCARSLLNGEKTSIGEGLSGATKKFANIFTWALISATIGIVLRIIDDKASVFVRILSIPFMIAWNLLTFFVVPVIIFEKINILQAIKESGYIFRKTWKENFVAGFSFSLYFLVFAVFGLIPFAIALYFDNTVFVGASLVFLAIYLTILATILSSLNGILVVALYDYAKNGKINSLFGESVKEAFGEKKKMTLSSKI